MPLFDGPVMEYLRKYRIIRRLAVLVAATGGLVFLVGKIIGWW